MKLDELDPRVTAFVLGELEPEENAEFQEAAKADPELQRAIDEISAAMNAVNAAFVAAVSESLTPDARAQIDSKAHSTVSRRPSVRPRFVLGALATAAALLVVLLPMTMPRATDRVELSLQQESEIAKRLSHATRYDANKNGTNTTPATQEQIERRDGLRAETMKYEQLVENSPQRATSGVDGAAQSDLNSPQLDARNEELKAIGYAGDDADSDGVNDSLAAGDFDAFVPSGTSSASARRGESRDMQFRASDASSPAPPTNDVSDLGTVMLGQQVNEAGRDPNVQPVTSPSAAGNNSGAAPGGGSGFVGGGGGFGGGEVGRGGLGGGGGLGGQARSGEQIAFNRPEVEAKVYSYFSVPPAPQDAKGLESLGYVAETQPAQTDWGFRGTNRWYDARLQKDVEIYQAYIVPQLTTAYASVPENAFVQVAQEPLSTFSLDVDTASYANVRGMLTANRLPPPDAVRLEEFVNAFKYSYGAPDEGAAMVVHADIAGCPWNLEHRLARIAVKAKDVAWESQPPLRLTFLIDVSGSMEDARKLPLLKESMKALVAKLRSQDQIAIVKYADNASVALKPTACSEPAPIVNIIDSLSASGSTNGADGLAMAYDLANDQYVESGLNRVVIATDGDFNVGTTDKDALVQRIMDQAKRGVFLTVIGCGVDNLQDDRLETLANKGNGAYYYFDNFAEARRVLVDRAAGTLAAVAKDAKIQVEFNPAKVGAYRLLGYENRALATQDFNDDRKDAGDVGAGQTVTAIYELVPYGASVAGPMVDSLKYQQTPPPPPPATASNEMMTVKLRYKQPTATESTRTELPVMDNGTNFDGATIDFQWASTVAAFAMLLRGSPYAGNADLEMVQKMAEHAAGSEPERQELVSLIVTAKTLIKQLPTQQVEMWNDGRR